VFIPIATSVVIIVVAVGAPTASRRGRIHGHGYDQAGHETGQEKPSSHDPPFPSFFPVVTIACPS
jgi:hypothetical protein